MGDSGIGATNAAAQAAAESAREAAIRDQTRWEQTQQAQKAADQASQAEQSLKQKTLQDQEKMAQAKAEQERQADLSKTQAQSVTQPYDATDTQLRNAAQVAAAQNADSGLPGFTDLKKKQTAVAPGGYMGQNNSLTSKAGVNLG